MPQNNELRRMRHWPNRDPDIDPEDPDAVVISDRDLRMFILQVYLGGALLCLLSAIPWICVSALKPPVQREIPVPPFIWLVSSFFLLTVLSCIPQTRVTVCMCWGLVFGSLFFTTLFGCYFVVNLSVWLISGCMAASVFFLAVLHLFGGLAPRKLLPSQIFTCFVALFGFITLFVLLMMSLFTNEKRYILASAIVFFIIVVCLAPFQASFNCGRLRRVPYGETASCANGLYMHFWFIMTCLIIFVEFKNFNA